MKKRNVKGQVLPFVAIIILVLAMFVVVLVNIGEIEYNRQRAQAAADAAAITYMRNRAGLMNSMGFLNTVAYAPFLGMGIAPGIFLHNKTFLTPYGTVISPMSIDGMETWIKERLLFFGVAISGVATGNHGGPIWAATDIIKKNGCEMGWKGVPGALGSITKTGLQCENITLVTCNIKIIYVYGVPVPIPLPPYEKEKKEQYNYVCRDFSMDKRNAQPPDHRVTLEATKKNTLWFGGLVGLPSPGPARAMASAKLYLDVTEGSKVAAFQHNGGFPRYRKDEKAAGYGMEPFSAYPKFDGVMVPVKIAVELFH